jgi:hypothetical protein
MFEMSIFTFYTICQPIMKTLNTISDEIIRSLSSSISCLIIVNVIFLVPQRKKSFGDKSGQAVGPNLPIESSLERKQMYF